MLRIKVMYKGMCLFSESVSTSPEVWVLIEQAETAGLLVLEVQREGTDY